MLENSFFLAVKLADRLSREPNISAINSSDLKRALETAETIAASCGKLQVRTFTVEFYQIGL